MSQQTSSRVRVRGARAAATAALLLLTMCEQPFEPRRDAVTPKDAARAVLPGPDVVLVGAGNIALCTNNNDELTAQILDTIPGTVIALGDNDRRNGTPLDFGTCYGPTWGRHKDRTRPAAGEREYASPGPADYFAYFGAAAGDPDKGYYSYDAGEWHVIVLNTVLSHIAGSAQEAWLKADLATNTKRCSLAYWDSPRWFSSGSTGFKPSLDAVWTDLYNAGVELVLNGHNGYYERFAPQQPDATADAAYGIRQIIVGTGGGPTNSFNTTPMWPNSEVQSSGTPGVVKLVLSSGSYSWQFIPIAGKTFSDAGTGTCHDSPQTQANAGGPYLSEGTVSFDGSHSFDPQKQYPLTFAWDFGDGSTGTGEKPVHAYAADGTYTVTLVATDAAGNASVPVTTTATIGNLPPTVSASNSLWSRPGQALTLSASVGDPGPDDGAWSYRIDWGDGSAVENGSLSVLTDPISAVHTYATVGSYTATIAVTDKDGGTGSSTTAVTVSSNAAAEVILAAGDISACFNDNDEATAKVLDGLAGTVFTLGDNAYPNGAAADFSNCYTPTWGRHKARTYATLGNHDYDLGNADAAFDYFGARVGPRGKGYYSMDLGDWHVIVLNDNGDFVPVTTGSVQDQWLQADLAANRKRCTLAIWHQPRIYSPDGVTPKRQNFWDRLYAAGAELVLNGHEHQYERFTPMKPDGTPDADFGIREIIVGTGGEGTGNMRSPVAPNSEALSNAYGVLKVTLRTGGYDWQFMPVEGETFTDAGSGTCHGPPTGEVTETQLSSNGNPSIYGQPVTFTASVHSSSGVAVDGAVTFIEGTDCQNPVTPLGGPVAIVSDQATLTSSALDAVNSPHSITACYDGGRSFVPSAATMSQQVSPATVTVTLSDLSYVYDGGAKAATVTTAPPGLPVSVAYTLNGAPVASPVNAGSYVVRATMESANYTGSATGTLTIGSAPATVSLSSLSQVYDGSAKAVTVTTAPAGLPVSIAYTLNGVPVASPVNAGSYVVTATIASTNYTGSATATLTIARASQTIAFAPLPTRTMGDPSFTITAQSSIGALVSFTSSTDACTVSASTLSSGTSSATVQLTNVGIGTRACTLTARNLGDANSMPASDVVRSFEVLAAFDAVSNSPDNSITWDGKKSKEFTAAVLTIRNATGQVLFDATKLDPATVRFIGTKATTGILTDRRGYRFQLKDVDGDGDIDILMYFDALQLYNSTDVKKTVSAVLTGSMKAPDGRAIRGVSTIRFK